MRIVLPLLLFLAVTGILSYYRTRHRPARPSNSKRLEVGQRWAFVGRSTDPAPRATILRLEPFGRGEVVHLAIDGVILGPARPDGSHAEGIAHLPLAREAVEQSVTQLEADKVPLPDFAAGYQLWLESHGGAFNLSIAAALDMVEHTMAEHPDSVT